MASQIAAGNDKVSLEKTQDSQMTTMQSLGTDSFKMTKKGPQYDDPREERKKRGRVWWRPEHEVPDVGGLGWRSKTGHLLKNQAYYRSANQNLWDDPVHAGPNTWKAWHGPKLRTDAPLMEKMDFIEHEKADWEAKKAFVNTTRVQTLDRFYNRKLNREQYENSSSWAPHHRDRGEIHDHFGSFDGDINSIPVKFLKQVLTPAVLAKDKEAIKAITKKLQHEETWKMAWKMMEATRREDIRQDLEQRRMFNDVLTQMAGQPPRVHDPEHKIIFDGTARVEEMSKPKEPYSSGDVTNLSDYRGLVHADYHLALETLFPGTGFKDCHEFRSRVSTMSVPGYPPPQVESPEPRPPQKPGAEKKQPPRVSMASVPASKPRVGTICSRTNDETLACYAKEQYHPCQAPPAPDQRETLMKEDWGRVTTMELSKIDPMRMTGNFARKMPHEYEGAAAKSQINLPPPMRQFNYPMLAPMAEKTRAHTEKRIEAKSKTAVFNEEANEVREMSGEPDAEALPTGRQTSRKSTFQKVIEKPPVAKPKSKSRPRRNSAARKAGLSLSARGPSPGSQGSPSASQQMAHTARDTGYSSITQGFIEPEPSAASVCKDLDAFEAVYEPVARLGNFFCAPHVPRATPSAAVPASSMDDLADASANQPLQTTGLTSTGDVQDGFGVTITREVDDQAQFEPMDAPEPQPEQQS